MSTVSRPTTVRALTTLAAGALALGFLAPSVASATTVDGYSAGVQQAAVEAITSEQAVTEATAERILRTQKQGARTLRQVEAQLGAQQEGGYLNADGAPVVNVLETATAGQVRAAGATPKLVSRSAEQLADARESLEAVPAVAHTAIGIDQETNQVVLTIAGAADDAKAAELLATAAGLGDAVRVVRTPGTFAKAIYNGEAITGGGSRCSAGFNTNSGGTNYIVDAGHCTGAVAEWNVGPSVDASFPTNDYGLIQNTTGSAPGAVQMWDGTTQPITSAANATEGQQICKSGSTTNLTCGEVQATGVTVNYAEGAVHDLVQTSAGVGPGDSGGCLFAGSTGLGITSGMGGGSSFFQPVVEALNAYGVALN